MDMLRIYEIAEVLYRFDPADTGSKENGITDEYEGEAAIIADNFNKGLIKDKDDLSECLHDVFLEYFSIKIDYNADLVNELFEVLNRK